MTSAPDPNYQPKTGERLAGYLAAAWATVDDIRAAAHRQELSHLHHQAARIQDALEDLRAVVKYHKIDEIDLTAEDGLQAPGMWSSTHLRHA